MSINNNYKAIKRNAKKFFKSPFFRAKINYTKYYESLSINEKEILIESYGGSSISGNGYQLLLEILNDQQLNDYTIFIACQKNQINNIAEFLRNKGIVRVRLIKTHSKRYVKLLASCKYLINNSTFPSYFIKKPGQIYFNSWHGTPLKTLGRSIASAPNEIGNTQRNFFMADYLLYPNEFTFNHMKKDYMLDDFYKGKYILSGYPRNGVFYDNELKIKIREQLELVDTEVICYMPTWRGTLDSKNNEEQYINIMFYLYKMDKALNPNKIMYVKLHNYVSSIIDFNSFKYIKPFPIEYETYEFLSIADCLITDYSSVFFDFANTGKKIILFAYDKEEYLSTRGMYLSMDELPFNQAETVGELIKEIEDLNDFNDYKKFINEYCKYDNLTSRKDIVDLIFHNKIADSMEIINGNKYANKKENVLIYGGALSKNGITTSLRGLIHNIDLDERNYTILFYRNMVKKNNYVISDFPEKLSYISIQGQKNLKLIEALVQFVYLRLNINNKYIKKHLDNIYQREATRIFGDYKFDYVIHFTGYEKHIANMFGLMDTHKTIYVHNDMAREKETKSNYHIDSIFGAYTKYDTIVGVRESMKEEIAGIMPNRDTSKIKIIHNINNIEYIKNNAKLPIEFNQDTVSTHSVEEIETILNDKNSLKFINVARYSPEKGIDRLITAFERYSKTNPNAYLIVIGGLGVLYKELVEHVTLNNLNKIVLIRSLSNPFPLLVKSDAFVLSSLYEGLPMSIMEALILGKPVISTNITGPKEFLQQGYGQLVDNSIEGIEEGFRMFERGEIKLKKFDPVAFNEQAKEEFYSIFDK